jgi:hypothetical protein
MCPLSAPGSDPTLRLNLKLPYLQLLRRNPF